MKCAEKESWTPDCLLRPMRSFGPAWKRTRLTIRSKGRGFLLRWVETGDLSVPRGRIWLTSDRPLATTSFRAWCLAIRPGARLQNADGRWSVRVWSVWVGETVHQPRFSTSKRLNSRTKDHWIALPVAQAGGRACGEGQRLQLRACCKCNAKPKCAISACILYTVLQFILCLFKRLGLYSYTKQTCNSQCTIYLCDCILSLAHLNAFLKC